MKATFHNGWKAVSQDESIIKEKENQILPTQHSMAADFRRTAVRESNMGRSKASIKEERIHMDADKVL